MPLVAGKCPNCGGTLEINKDADAAICKYCKTPFIVEKAIQLCQTQNTYNTVNNISDSVVNIIKGESAQEQYDKITALLMRNEKEYANEMLVKLTKKHPESSLIEEAKLQLWLYNNKITPYGNKQNVDTTEYGVKNLFELKSIDAKAFEKFYAPFIAQLNENLKKLTEYNFEGDMPYIKTVLFNIDEKLPKSFSEAEKYRNYKQLYYETEDKIKEEYDMYIKSCGKYFMNTDSLPYPKKTELCDYYSKVIGEISWGFENDYGQDGLYLAYVYSALTKDEKANNKMRESIGFFDKHYKDIIAQHLQLVAERNKAKKRADYLAQVERNYKVLINLYESQDFRALDTELKKFAKRYGIKLLKEYRKRNITKGVFGKYKCKEPLPSWQSVKDDRFSE